MLATNTLDAFTRELDALVVEHAAHPAEIPALAAPLLERLLCQPRFAPAVLPSVEDGRGGRALLHQHPDGLYTVWSMAFPAGHCTPIHNHNTWGIVGVWRGEEREEKYHRVDDGARAGHAELASQGTTVNAPGRVVLLVPPRDDVHRIWNETDAPAWSVHIYGKLLGTEPAWTFDAETGRIASWQDDPLATARLWGLPAGSPDLRSLLGLPTTSDEAELLRVMRERLATLGED